jgi:signal transduction histidine kinase
VVEGTLEYFKNFRHVLILVSQDGTVLLSVDQSSLLDSAGVEVLRQQALLGAPDRRFGSVTLANGRTLRFAGLAVTGSAPFLRSMLVAADVREVAFPPAALLRSMLVTGPVVLLLSVLLGYSLAGGSLRPLEEVVDELTAITDGRSLHRRLPVDPTASAEVTRIVQGVNGMFARLEQSFASQQRFVADASHELKTPLMVLRAGVERALTSTETPPESLQALDETLQEVNRMSELVNNLLTLARADEGRAPLAVEEGDLRDLVNEAAETAHILAEVSGIEVRIVVPDTLVRIAVDRTRMRQLLLNLVTNAVKYTQAGGEVSLGLAQQGDLVQLVVRDTGIGIAAGDLPHIFDRFWRVDPARSRDADRAGSGLGLAITKWIAEAHGGTISVQSRPGRGTVFTVSLPRSASSV